MSKLQIPLNGSNIVNKDRHQAFNDALQDNHQIDCGENGKVQPARLEQEMPAKIEAASLTPRISDNSGASQENSRLEHALEHTFKHQARTMEIHQQYLAQQTDYLQLVASVLEQQGRVLSQGNGSEAALLIQTFQKTLDNFHVIREQGLRVHQEFLHQQSAFSEHYLQALEGSQPRPTREAPQPPPEARKAPMAEWVVQQPPIIVDDYTPAPTAPTLIATPLLPNPETRVETKSPPAAKIPSAELQDALLEIVAEKTGYPAEMLEIDMDLEADLGIDSIKRVEILGSLEERYPSLPPADTEVLSQTRTLQEILAYMELEAEGPAASPGPAPEPSPSPAPPSEKTASPSSEGSAPSPGASAADLKEILLEIVAEKTGYPAEMLELEMDMEADLGIDSIKRVEILGSMEEQLPGLPKVEAESLANLRTLGQIVELMGRTPSVQTAPAGEDTKKKAEPGTLENTAIGLRPLPHPDQLELAPDPERTLILTDDGSEFSGAAAAKLIESGWNVVLWSFPEQYYTDRQADLPEGIPVLHQAENGREGIAATLTELRSEYGIPAGLIHLHPRFPGEGLFSSSEEGLIKQVFLLSGAVKVDLEHPPAAGRNFLLSVTRGDGSLGLNGGAAFQEGSGLAGLIKTLRWEWPDVFCRYLDLSLDLPPAEAGQALLHEIHDPDRGLVEVGISPGSRVTIERITS